MDKTNDFTAFPTNGVNMISMILMSDWNSIESVGVETGLNRVVSSE